MSKERVIGYIGAPLEYPDRYLDKFTVFSPEEYRKNPRGFWRFFDPLAVELSMGADLRGVTMITYRVQQKDTGDLTFRPTNLFRRIERSLFMPMTKNPNNSKPSPHG